MPARETRNVYVLGLDEHHRARLADLPDAERYRFRPLLDGVVLQPSGEIPVDDFLERARGELDAAEEPVDAIVGFWDFPVSTMVPILAGERGLRSASLACVLRCEHKYWSRLEQQRVIDEYPRFALVDLEHDNGLRDGLRYPVWLKPVKAFSSELAFAVADDDEFRVAVARIREGVGRVGDPFDRILEQVDLPPAVASAGGTACLAEETSTGRQLTVEGYVQEGNVQVYGVVATVQHDELPTIERYQYPATLPDAVSERLQDVSRRLVTHLGLDDTTFNVEYFWDADEDRLEVLEINPRHSASHADLLEQVDGAPNHQAMVRVALGENPGLRHRAGPYAVAAKCFVLRHTDGVVTRVPERDEVDRAVREVEGVVGVEVGVEVGDRLSELPGQDSYAYKIADVLVAADDEEGLMSRFHRCSEMLPFELAD